VNFDPFTTTVIGAGERAKDVIAEYNYLRQEGYVFAGFCLSVCVCVYKITQKVMEGSF